MIAKEWLFKNVGTREVKERGKAGEKERESGRDPCTALCVVWGPPGLFRGECMSAPFLGSERKGENKIRRKRKSLHNKGNVCLCLCARTNEWAVLLCGISKQTLACFARRGEITVFFANISTSPPNSVLFTGPSTRKNEAFSLWHIWSWDLKKKHVCTLVCVLGKGVGEFFCEAELCDRFCIL